MKHNYYYGLVSLSAMCMLSGCINDKYDLSDIDTTTCIKIKDLVLPINIAPITLGDVITINEGDRIQEITINGEKVYAVSEKGDFSSSDITIKKILSESPTLEDALVTITTASVTIPSSTEKSFPFPNKVVRPMTYKALSLDESIESVDDLYLEGSDFVVNFHVPSINGATLALTDLRFKMPKGLTVSQVLPAGTYDNETGVCSVPKLSLQGGRGEVRVTISQINMEANNTTLDDESHDLVYRANLDIESANLTITTGNGPAALPASLNIDIDYELDDMNIVAFSGNVNYTLEDIEINSVSLTDIPDIFSQDANLILANPQIYLSLSNPVADYDLNYQVGIELTANREGEKPKTFIPDNKTFTVGHNKGINGPYIFCLSPEDPTSYPTGFTGASHVEFSSLGSVLSGEGLPESIGISLPETKVYSQHVEHFKLGEENKLKGLEGKWEFLAPIALSSENGTPSRIIYSRTQDGWSDDEVDAIEIEALQLMAKVDSDLPVDAILSGYPIDKNGKKINGAEFEPITIPGGAKNQSVVLKLKVSPGKPITGLDGITYKAELVAVSPEALSPDQSFSLKEIQIKVSGNYTKEF